MKIAKNEHKTVAVVFKESDAWKKKTMGKIIPLEGRQNLEGYIKGRVRNVRGLYKILGIAANSKLDKDKTDEVLYYFNRYMQLIISRVSPENERQLEIQAKRCVEEIREKIGYKWIYEYKRKEKKTQKEDKQKMHLSQINLDISEAFVHDLVQLHIRGSLKKTIYMEDTGEAVYIPDIIEKLVIVICKEKDVESAIKKDIEKEKLERCMVEILKDYTMLKQVKEISKSIYQQDVKVQVFEKNDTYTLKLANAEHEKKKYLFEFIEKYACGDQESRMDMLREVYGWIILYLCGQSAYEKLKDINFSVWNTKVLSEILEQDVEYWDERSINLVWEINSKNCEKKKLKMQLNEDNKKLKEEYKKIISIIDENNKEIRQILRKKIAVNYIQAKNFIVPADSKEDEWCAALFWLNYIEHNVEKQLGIYKKKSITENKLRISWLVHSVWRDIISYITSKFIDQGKAVYHFAMPDLRQIGGKAVKIGEVDERLKKGITSFDYERITAEEQLERNVITACIFAINNYATAVCPPEAFEGDEKKKVEDILSYDAENLCKKAYDNAVWRILQYFGGYSQWMDMMPDKEELILSIKDALSRVRNFSYHYTSSVTREQLSQDSVLIRMFKKEKDGVSRLIRKKYYSNNVPMFYSVEDINKLMDQIYSKDEVIETQIPSFKNVFSMKDLSENISKLIAQKSLQKLQKDAEVAGKFKSSFYFILKDVYYHQFLQLKDLKERFEEELKDEKEVEKDKKRQNAIKNFSKRLLEYENNTTEKIEFGDLCQLILTDYNLQNTQKRVRTNKNNKLPDANYEHFPMLLYKCIRKAFIKYVKQEVMHKEKPCYFLKRPVKREKMPLEEAFCNGWGAALYADLDLCKNDAWMISMYIVAHFIPAKYLNHLKGTIKGYLSYVEHIEDRRYRALGIQYKLKTEEYQIYRNWINILNLASEYCGRISSNWKDYYVDEEEYAQDISQYVQFAGKDSDNDYLAAKLQAFCNQKEENSASKYIGIYYDGKDPILNRNIVLARQYGIERLITKCIAEDKITESEIRKYHESATEMVNIFKKMKCDNSDEEEKRRKYQQQKNRIELVDIKTYAEIMNDLMAQLISWCYLRERDRMYLQLGIHYIRLKSDKGIVEKESKFRVLKSRDADNLSKQEINIEDGAILYQLVAIYTYELPVYCLDKDGYAVISKKAPANTLTSNGVTAFYKEYCKEEWQKNNDTSIYEAGLELFENKAEEKELFAFRDYIDHSKYFARRDQSMLELYGKIYNKFFEYDTKLRKNSLIVLSNIMARYFVITKFKLNCEKTGKNIETRIEIESMRSDATIHKFEEEGKKIRFSQDYYDERFLKRLKDILEYNRG